MVCGVMTEDGIKKNSSLFYRKNDLKSKTMASEVIHVLHTF